MTLMQSIGVDINTIKSLAGHADTEMTEHYIHVHKETKLYSSAQLSESLKPSELRRDKI